jgi:lipopolysaccharide export system protein LptC
VKVRTNTLFSLTLAAGLAALTLWLERMVEAPAGSQPNALEHDPDFIVERFTATSLDKGGRPESRLTARRMTHYPDDETTELEEPQLVQYREQGPPVRISAERGTVTKDGEEVRLYGNVLVVREGTKGRPSLNMETTFLQVFPKQDIARTPEAVVITEGQSRLTGVGMDYNTRTRQLELKARVNGTFVRAAG